MLGRPHPHCWPCLGDTCTRKMGLGKHIPGNSTAPDSREEVTRHKCQSVSCSVMPDSVRPPGLQPARLLCPWDSPGKNTGVGCCALFQGIFPTRGSTPGLLHCMQILQGIKSSHWGLRTSLQHLPKVCLCSVEGLRKPLSSSVEGREAGGEAAGMAARLLLCWGDSTTGQWGGHESAHLSWAD